ncbi:MAG: hypothetical protein ACOYOV_01180 [Bacteroidales bacterium]
MHFVSDVLANENGIQWYYIIGLLIFLTLFIILVYRVIKTSKSDLVQYKESILKDDDAFESNLKN